MGMSDMPALKVPNLPTPEGRALGVELARICDGEAERRTDVPERCATCAFRAGTYPNGCAATLMNATKCVAERVPFFCHECPGNLCSGFRLMVFDKKVHLPWPFSE